MSVQVTRCRSCDESIVWMKTAAGKNIPVDADSIDEDTLEFVHNEQAGRPDYRSPVFDPDEHVTHFRTCPNADEHRRRR